MRKLLLILAMFCLPAFADLNFTTYYIPSWPPNIANPGNPVSSGTVPNLSYNWGSGSVLNSGLSDRVLVHFTGYVNWAGTAGTQKTITFYAATDDGFKMTVNGSTVVNGIGDLHGAGFYNYTSTMTLTAGQSYALDVWWSEWTGGAVMLLYWDLGDGNGIVSVPSTAFTVVQPPQYNSNITAAQQIRVNAYFSRTISNNSVYIDQTGNYNTVNVTQVGLKNLLTGTDSAQATIRGDRNNITVRQGDQSNDSGKNEIALKVQGDYNTLTLNQALSTTGASVGSTSGHYQLVSVLGSNNAVTIQQTNNGSGSHYLENNITGNSNNIAAYQINNGNKLLFLTVNGNTNTVSTTQRGTGNHYLDITLGGNGNSASVTQNGSVGHKATINLVNAGGPASLILNQISNNTGLIYSISQSCVILSGCSVSVTQP